MMVTKNHKTPRVANKIFSGRISAIEKVPVWLGKTPDIG
jgi:hypothetical protein